MRSLVLGTALLASAASASGAQTEGRLFGAGLGLQIVEGTSSGLLLGLDVGPEFRVKPGLTLSVEAVLRYTSIELEGNVRGGVLGVQLVAAWRGSGR